tara:strand:- start:158 stop:952 length:795 start_codon:yes stop_codon:yes gene_type:complete
MKKYFVIGNPIDHSLSPQLHNYWLKKNNINAIYEKQKLNINDLQNFVLKIKNKEISGANITVPFKKEIIPYLDELSLEALNTQSVNIIYLSNDKVVGHNTDINGFELALRDTEFKLSGKKVFILGAGGVVPSIIFALNKMKVSSITLSNRTKSKAENLKKLFKNILTVDWGEIPDFDIIINATSLGLKSEDNINLDLSKIEKGKLFYDIIYNPNETKFLKYGKMLENKTENGKKMFLHQAAAAFKIWHGIQPKISNETIKLLDQ